MSDLGKIENVIRVGRNYKELIKGNSVLTVDDPEIQALARALLKSASTMNELLTLLFEFVNQKIRYVSNGVRYSAAEALRNREGDCREF